MKSSKKKLTKKPKAVSKKAPSYMVVQGVQCGRCDEKIWSRSQNDFRYCGCGTTFVDGGRSYLRYGFQGDFVPKQVGIRVRI